jgi:hypothetical protein
MGQPLKFELDRKLIVSDLYLRLFKVLRTCTILSVQASYHRPEKDLRDCYESKR